MVPVHGVFRTGVFRQALARIARFPGARICEGLGVELRILDRRVHVDVLRVGPRPTLHHVQRIAMRAAVFIGPYLRVFETNRIDHESIAVPVAHFVAKERRIGVFLMLAPVGGN